MNSSKKNLRIKPVTPRSHQISNLNNKAEAAVARSNTKKKEQQLTKAVSWCKEHNVRGYSVIKFGLFPLIKNERTINK